MRFSPKALLGFDFIWNEKAYQKTSNSEITVSYDNVDKTCFNFKYYMKSFKLIEVWINLKLMLDVLKLITTWDRHKIILNCIPSIPLKGDIHTHAYVNSVLAFLRNNKAFLAKEIFC